MAGVVVPFRGRGGKSRLQSPLREELALAMLGDVLEASVAVGPTVLVTGDDAAAVVAEEMGARILADPGGGQGAAVAAALEELDERPLLVVNADLPGATARDLLALLGAAPPAGMAVVVAADGTTNALALPAPHVFEALYGPGSAERFRRHARRLGIELVEVSIPNLAEDVDTMADLARLDGGVGPRTQAALSELAELAR